MHKSKENLRFFKIFTIRDAEPMGSEPMGSEPMGSEPMGSSS